MNGKIKNSNHFGSITWDGKNAGFVQLIDVPKLATLKKEIALLQVHNLIFFQKTFPLVKLIKFLLIEIQINL